MRILPLHIRYIHYIEIKGMIKDLINHNVCERELSNLRDIYDKLEELRTLFQKPVKDLLKEVKQ